MSRLRGTVPEHEALRGSTTEGLPISPSLGPVLEMADIPPRAALVDGRTVFICGVSILLAAAAALVAQLLVRLIGLITNISFFGRVSTEFTSPAENHLGLWVLLIPIVGGLIVGVMARFGSAAIRGHGIPEAMEQVLTNRSRIAPRVTLLKPISAAISIGTGGPFGAEGPIIATGGALGSVIGQFMSTTASERKTLLAVGAAAGMSATFGSPVSAVLLAVELLLFEYRPRSLIPVALASTTAAGIRMMFEGAKPIFAMPDVAQATGGGLAAYILIGAALGLLAVLVTRSVYAIEDAFDRLPFHWMWWPALGAIAVGVVGYFVPRTLGVGYSNIGDVISGRLAVQAMVVLAAAKFVSWAISLGSGTSGGTLAPLFTIGGGVGAILGNVLGQLMPHAGIDSRVAGLVGMAAIFSGASRALLASIVFAFETTMQPHGLLPLLGGCTASYLVSCLLMRQTIMTEKIHRRGVRVPIEYAADFFDQLIVAEVASKNVIQLRAQDTLGTARSWLSSGEPGSSHQGFPVCDENGNLVGVLTRRDLLGTDQPLDKRLCDLIRRPPVVVYHDCTLREAADHMVNHDIGRLPVVSRDDRRRLVGMITRSDLLSAHRRRLGEHVPEPALPLPQLGRGKRPAEKDAKQLQQQR